MRTHDFGKLERMTEPPSPYEVILALDFLMRHPKYGDIGEAWLRDAWRWANKVKEDYRRGKQEYGTLESY